MRIISLLSFIVCLLLSSCKPRTEPNLLIIGTIAGPETELVQTAAHVAQDRFGLTVKIVEFNDYNLPNMALNEGSLDLNIYQHLPYLNAAIAAHHYQLEPVAKTFLYPMALYSQKHSRLSKLPIHASIALPNDPSNEARALNLLHDAHLITLSTTVALPSLQDIKSNPKQLVFKSLDAAQLPRVLADVDAAIINTTFAIPAGLSPKGKEALWIEKTSSPYTNLIVQKTGESLKKDRINQFIEAFQSDPVKQKARDLFQGAAIPAW